MWKITWKAKNVKNSWWRPGIFAYLAHYSLFRNTKHIMWYYSRLLSNRYQQPCHGLYTFKNTLACLKTLITLLMNTLPFFCKEQNILIFRSNCWTGISLTHILSPSECCLVYGMCASNLQCSVQHQKAHDKIQITQETERQTDVHTETDRETDRYAYRETDRKTDRYRQRDRPRDRQIQTDIHTETDSD